MGNPRLRLPKVIGTILLLAVLPFALLSQTAAATPGFSFTTFELGRFDVAGVTCPGSTSNCWNANAEPQIRADPAGNFYATAEFLPRILECAIVLDLVNPACGGTGAWKSSDNGLHYSTLVSPNSLSNSCDLTTEPTCESPFGGDTDVAVAPQKNPSGFYNVYVVSLERASGPLLTVEESTSRDGGKTWSINPTGATVPINDRPWVAADGSNSVCVSYHNISLLFDILVSCSSDGGNTFAQVASAFDVSHTSWFEFETQIGNIAIDANSHVIYQIFDSAVASQSEAIQCATLCSNNFHSVWVGVSIDGGKSFTDYPVFINPNIAVGYNHQFSQVSVDKAGNVYALYTDDHNVFYSFSSDFGKHWSPPFPINTSPSNTAIFPWSAAGSPGKLDVVWYGTSFFDGVTIPDNYPMSAAWHVFFAQTQNALTSSPSFTQVAATGVIHLGGVCEAGVTCSGNRDLFDDFGVAASPITGLASIVHDNDQFLNTASDPASPTCTPAKTNSGACTRTDIATQTSGLGIFVKPKGFEIRKSTLHLSSSGGPQFDLAATNTGTQAITAISVQIGGLGLALSWNSSLPLAPAGTISASTTVMPAGLTPVSAGVYTVVVTATLADGTSVTQSINVIFTLLSA